VWANRSLAELLGVPVEELLGLELADLSAQRSPADWTQIGTSLLQGTGGERSGSLHRVDDTTVTVQVCATRAGAAPTAPEGGGRDPEPADGWLVTLRPVLDGPDELQAALRQAEHRFSALAGPAPVGIFVSEVGLRLGYANQCFGQLLGMGPHRILGTGWLDAVHPDDLGGFRSTLEAVLGGAAAEISLRVALPASSRLPGSGRPDDPLPAVDDTSGHAWRWLHLRLAPTTTPSRAAGFIGTAEDVTERRAWEERITYQAHHDALTGLVNRRRLVEVLQHLLESRRVRDREFAVLFLDLDRFKQVNDTFGHDAGDRVLIEVARRLQRTAREFDLLARVAGDEFVVVLRSVSQMAEAEAAARRHLAALAEPFVLGRQDVPLSASVGVALPASYDTPESLLRAADRVMYDAKASGAGGYRLAAVGPPAGGEP
jgi:diguanylate cyclase (GGDEF)-like protein